MTYVLGRLRYEWLLLRLRLAPWLGIHAVGVAPGRYINRAGRHYAGSQGIVLP